MTESQADAEEVHFLNLIVQRGLCISNCQVFGYIQQLHSAGLKPNAAHFASAIRSCAKEARQRVDIYIYIIFIYYIYYIISYIYNYIYYIVYILYIMYICIYDKYMYDIYDIYIYVSYI